VSFLLECPKIKKDAVDFEGNTALHFAVTYGHLKITYFLLMSGANPKIKNILQAKPEDIAKSEQNDSILHLFVSLSEKPKHGPCLS